MKILVTGGAGFIGSHVCEALLARGDSVICVDNFDDFYNPRIKEENLEHSLKSDNFKLFREDILNLRRMKEIFNSEKPDKVVHLAALAGVRPSIKDPFSYQEVNIKGTLNLLELAREFGVKSFVFASSSSIYGDREGGPFSEEDKVDFPISPYAATKKSGEEWCYCYHYLYGLKITCLRFFTVYGPRQRPDLAIRKFVGMVSRGEEIPVFGEGNSARDYTYVGDIARGVLKSLDKEFSFEVINLGNGSPVKLGDLIKLIEKEVGKEARIRRLPLQEGDVSLTFAKIDKAKELLGWEPEVGIEDGIKKFVEWTKD